MSNPFEVIRRAARRTASWMILSLVFPVAAHAALTVNPLTWNVIGLDSNSPTAGPKNFPVGARVCSDVATVNVVANFVFDSANSNISLRAGSLSTLSFPSIGAGACIDAYFEIEVTQVAAAYDTTRRYHVTATDGSGTYSSPTPRELYVEHLISQSRNSITNVRYGTSPASLVPVAAGGALNLVVGNTYTIELDGGTATQGYEQFEAFINFSNAIFQILAVNTSYSADSSPYVPNPSSLLYADACLWESDPNSPNYRSCIGIDGKAGGSSVVTTYTIKIIAGGSSQTLNTLLYDFSGSSFHYNGDYSVGARVANIIDPTTAGITKSFSPNPAPVNGVSVLTLTLTNPNTGALSGYNVVDTLPAGMVIATPSGASTAGCGTPTLTANTGANAISFANGIVAGNGSCVIKVNVTTNATGNFVNTTGHLFIDTVDTGHTATATLTVNSAPPPGTGICGLALATWKFPSGFSVNAPAVTSSTVTVSADPGAGTTPVSEATITADGTAAWGSNGSITTGTTLSTANNEYFEFGIDTTGLNSVSLAFDAQFRSANGPKGVAVFYGTSNSRPETGTSLLNNSTALTTQNTPVSFNVTANSGLNGSGTTYFRVYFFNSGNTNAGSDPVIDDVVFTGCGTGTPATLTKTFAPNPIAINGVSTLSFALTNPNTTALTGAAFTDALPNGTQVAAAPAAATTCGGTWAPSAGATSLTFSNGTIPASGSCSVSVNVTATTAGPHANVSGFLTTNEAGTNTSSVASATLTALSPPQIAKGFSPSPIIAGAVSRLTFTIVNPNQNDTISGVAFNDTLPSSPGAMVVAATPSASTTGCGAPSFAPSAGAASLAFSAGTIGPGGTCSVSVNVTAPTVGTYNNTSGVVSFVINAQTINGNSASASLVVDPPHPAIGLLKQVGLSATGPWLGYTPVALPGSVYYQFTIENDGDVPLNLVTLTDPQVDMTSCMPPASLPVAVAANNNHIFSCVVGPVAATAGSHLNTATASGTGGSTVSATSSATYASATMSLAKSVTESSYTLPGDTLHYSYLVTNTGAATLDGPITVSDNKATVTCPALTTVGDGDSFFDPGELLTCTATYVVTAADVTAASVTNIAQASNDTIASNTDSRTVPLSSSADVSVVKTLVTPGPYTVGESLTFTLVVANAGPSTATNVQVTDTPTNLTIINVSGGGCAALPCTIAALASGANVTITITATIDALGSFDNAATATATQPDPNPSNNTDNTGNGGTTSASADLSIAKTDAVTSVNAGATVTYAIGVSNAGPSPANNAVFTDPGVSNLTVTSVTCTLANGGAVCPATSVAAMQGAGITIATFPSGGSLTFTVVGTSGASGSIVNTATIAAPAGTTDTNTANNSATDTDTINPQADLSITKTDGVTTATPGNTVTYTITASNAGPSDAIGATVIDTLPAVLTATWTCAGAGGGTCPASGVGNINASVNLPAGGSVTFTVSATISASATGTMSNTATVTAPGTVTDPNPGNNSATDIDTLTPSADLSITKTDGSSSYTPGATTTYMIVASNNGPSAVTGATISDTLAAPFTSDNWTATATGGATGFSASGTGNINDTVDMPVGSTITYTLSAAISLAATGNVSNTATIAVPAGTTDPTPGNNSATDIDSNGGSQQLTISKTATPSAFAVGQGGTYSLLVSNAGTTSTSAAITVADTLPTGISSSATPSGTNWDCSASTSTVVSCTTAAVLLPGENAPVVSVPVSIAVNAASPSVNTAIVSGGGDGTCPVAARCNSTISTPVDAPLINVNKVLQGSFVVGVQTAYVVTATNNGQADTIAGTITDAVPTGLAIGTLPAGCSTVGQNLTCTLPAGMATGGSVSYTIPVTPQASTDGTSITNIAVNNGGGDPSCPVANHCKGTTTNSVTAPQLSLSKSATPSSFVVNQPATYTLTLTNTGTAATTALTTITDTIPGGLTIGTLPTACSASGQTVTCTQSPPLNTGAPVNFSIPVTPTNALNGSSVTNTAGATGGGDPGCVDGTPLGSLPTRCVGSVTTAVNAPQLTLQKSASAATFVVGVAASYTLQVTNTGTTSTNAAATISDNIPSSLTLGTLPTGCAATGQQVTCTIGSGLTTGTSVSFVIPVTPTASSVPSVSNTATTQGGGDPTCPVAANCTSAVTTPVNSPQLTILKTASASNFVVGVAASYTLQMTNNGTADTTATATITDNVPGTLTLGAMPAGCSAAGQTVTCTVAAGLASGNAISFVIPVTPTAAADGTTLTNTATVSGGGDPSCPGGTNCTSTTTTPVNAPALQIIKSASASNFVVNVAASYTLKVTNVGTTATTATATVTDSIPGTLTIGTLPAGCSAAGQVVTCTIAAGLTTGAPVSFVIPVTPTAASNGTTLTNTASVSGGGDPSCPGGANCSSTVTTPVDAPALQIIKTASASNFVVGVPASYTLQVTNTGTAATTSTSTVTDNIPGALTIGAPPAGCGVTGQSVTCVIPAGLSSGSPTSFVIPVTPTAAAVGATLSNIATVSGGGDPSCPDGPNCSSTITTPVSAPALQLVKTASTSNFVVGLTASYTLQLTNIGTAATTAAVLITDVVPGTLTLGALPAGCTSAGQTVSCTVAAGLATGAPVSFVIPVTPTAAASGTTLSNSATASGGGDPSCPAGANCTSTVNTPVNAPALQIVKSASASNFVVGVAASYTLQVTNVGSAATTASLAVSDVIPGTLTIGTLPAGCSAAGQSITCTIAAGLATNTPMSFVIPVTPMAAASGTTLSNTATVSGGGDPSCPGGATCSSTVTTPVNAPQLQIVKTASASNFVVGVAASYTLQVTNTGSAATTAAASVSDNIPSTLTLGTPPSGCIASGQLVTCTIAAGLAANTPMSFVIPVTPTAAANGMSLSNTATVSGGGDPSCPGGINCSSTVTTPVNAPQLRVVKTSSSGAFTVGVAASYTLTVTNIGSAATTAAATVTDNVPSTLTMGALSAGCVATGQAVTCTIATGLAAGTSVSFVIPVTPTAAAKGNTLANTGTVSGGGDPSCPNGANPNCSSTVTTPVGAPALQILKTASSATFAVNVQAGYTLTVTNVGAAATTAVATVSDNVPGTLTLGTMPAGCTASGQQVTCTVASGLTPNASASFAIPVTPTAAAGGTTLTNTVIVSGGGDPSCPGGANCSSTVSTPVSVLATSADLQIVKAGPATVIAGQDIVYTISVKNVGPDAALAVVLSDPAPAGLVFVSSGAPCPTFPCNLGDIAANQTVTIPNVTFRVPTNYAGASVINVASVTSATLDPTPNNNSSSVSTAIIPSAASPVEPVPIDARWMLLMMLTMFAGIGANAMRHGRGTGRCRGGFAGRLRSE